MDFLRNNQRISFKYGGINLSDIQKETSKTEQDNQYITSYLLPDGLKVTNIAVKHEKYGAYEWVTYLENTGDSNTAIISEMCDCDVDFAFEYDKRPELRALIPQPDTTKIFNPKGSTCVYDEFSTDEEKVSFGAKDNYIFSGDKKTYTTTGGRSSNERAPFFDINRIDKGIIFAIGWTGQWCCNISRDDEYVNVKTGIENVSFRLYPHEKIRTSSIVILPYKNGQINAHNQWRRLLKEHYSLVGRKNRPKEGPLCNMFWGTVSSQKIADRIDKIGKNNLGYEYIWIDAGWYGDSKLPVEKSRNEYEGDWGSQTGDWRINPIYHPDGLQDVVSAIKRNNMKFLLWFEPERVINSVPIVKEHPEYFLREKDDPPKNESILLDLGNSEAWQYCFDTLCEKIEELGIDCYRQDQNCDPLQYWRDNDSDDRQGIHEIKHINGLYQLWDALLEKFPHLLIDNCAGGGRRIDIETLRRSIPLWRSDAQCSINFEVEVAQNHTMGINMWMPYSGSCGKMVNDTYSMRSGYAAAMISNFWFSEVDDFEIYDEETLNWIRKINAEYLQVRPYFSCDFYPLTENSVGEGSWCAYQFDRPENGDGIIMIFKRLKAKGITYQFKLGGISEDEIYTFTNADTDEIFDLSGKDILNSGFNVTIHKTRTAKLLFYHVKK